MLDGEDGDMGVRYEVEPAFRALHEWSGYFPVAVGRTEEPKRNQ